MTTLRLEVPRKLAPLLQPARYKGAHGGRGGAKSHFFAEKLIARCVREQTRWACIREVQNSIKDSVRQLLVDKIDKMGVGHLFEVLEAEIRCPHGGLIVFKGMQSYNAQTIKSLEGFDGAWVEEAQTLSAFSLRMLRPTIRKPGSEIWFSWNPRHDTDAVDEFLRGAKRPANAIVVEVNWQDNPWLPQELRDEKDHDYASDPEMAEHVWGGGYERISEGAYYAKLLLDAEREGRIGAFPYRPGLKLRTAWDIGVDDYTAVWFIQDDGKLATVVDYYETSGDGAEEIVKACMPELIPSAGERATGLLNIGREAPFAYSAHILPHDVQVREWGAGARTRFQSLTALGVKPIIVGAQQGPAERIAASRKLLPITRFNNTQRVQTGIKRLRSYRRKWNDAMQSFTTPLHDEASHGADAFGEYAVNSGIYPAPIVEKPKRDSGYASVSRTAEASWRV
jgi:phage terminase large subunit